MNNPKVSIALPVYNGEPFLGKTLDAILAQTFADFELLICDNASTDATEKICRQYAARDERISYYRNQRNIGAAGNFNQVFQLSSGEYFKWVAHDDLHAADYLAQCIEVLDSDRSVVLCHSLVQIIDQEGKAIADYTIKLNTDADNPVTRFGSLLSHHLCYPIFGLIRANVLEKTSLMGSYGHADGVLLASIALQGRFYEIPKPLFFSRNHSQQSMSRFFPEYLSLAAGDSASVIKLPDYYAYAVWFDPANHGRAIFPHWRIFWEYCRCIWQASLSVREKIGCHFSMFKQLKGREFLLLQDLIIAARQSFDSAIVSLQKTLSATVNLK
jgi:glycosyltransferase involved in cell wall biosynthesis